METFVAIVSFAAIGCVVSACTKRRAPLLFGFSFQASDLRLVRPIRSPLKMKWHRHEKLAFMPNVKTEQAVFTNTWNCSRGAAHFLTQDMGLRDECIALLDKHDIPHVISIVGQFGDVYADIDVDYPCTIEHAHEIGRSKEIDLGSYNGYACYRIQVRPEYLDAERTRAFNEYIIA